MLKYYKILVLFIFAFLLSCEENGDELEFADGYPSDLADNWIAFEFLGGDFDGTVLQPYKLVTSLDPNRNGSLIIDRIYNADVRVRTAYNDSAFTVVMGDQLELINTNNYGIEFISIEGYVTTNPVLTNLAFDLAKTFFENIAFYESDIEDVILMRAGFYDAYKTRIDTVLILGYRKTGFEDVTY